MSTEFEKMRNQEYSDVSDSDIRERLKIGKYKTSVFNKTYCRGPGFREALKDLVPTIPDSSMISPPFFCDYGDGIILGEHVFINMNCTFLDGGLIKIGNHTLVGPNVQIYTPHHPLDFKARRESVEVAYPVSIGDDSWIGGGVIICPGVTIGNRVVVGAGSVVTRDVPDDCVVVGNPARILKKLTDEAAEHFG